MKTRYKLDYAWHAEMVVEVDDEILTPEILKDWNEFWGGSEERSAEEGGPLLPLLKMMYLEALFYSVVYSNGTRDLEAGKVEGYPPMDGSCGITILSFDEFEFDDSEVGITVVPS